MEIRVTKRTKGAKGSRCAGRAFHGLDVCAVKFTISGTVRRLVEGGREIGVQVVPVEQFNVGGQGAVQ
jgi:hypothetical protein